MKKLSLVPVCLVVVALSGIRGNPLLQIVPSPAVGYGSAGLISTLPLDSSQILSSYPSGVQLVRQPTLLSQFPQQQQLLVGGVPLSSGVLGSNNFLVRNPGLFGLNPVLSSSSGLPGGVDASILLQQQLVNQQRLASVNPVVREVAEVAAPASVVPLDPMDAALAEMENQGQMHMEKYAWGRSSMNTRKPTQESKYRAEIPLHYSPIPVGSVVSSSPVDLSQTASKLRNPFVDSNGKRKKHFEFYQYFRNLDGDLIPVAVVPSLNNPQE